MGMGWFSSLAALGLCKRLLKRSPGGESGVRQGMNPQLPSPVQGQELDFDHPKVDPLQLTTPRDSAGYLSERNW